MSFLRFATKVRPEVEVEGSCKPEQSGANILERTVDQQRAAVPGPSGGELPFLLQHGINGQPVESGDLIWQDSSNVTSEEWAQLTYTVDSGGWDYSDANPDTGTYHLRTDAFNSGGSAGWRTGYIDLIDIGCSPDASGDWIGWKIPGGSTIEVGVRADVASLSGSPVFYTVLRVAYPLSNPFTDTDENDQQTAVGTAGSYVSLSHSHSFSAEFVYLVDALVEIRGFDSAVQVDFDSFHISIT